MAVKTENFMQDRGMTRVLVAGLGSIGRRHARLLSERDDVELLLCDRQPQFLAETAVLLAKPAAAEFQDFAAALAAGCDVVFVCTPTSTHAPLALQALAAGCDLFVEKPITTDGGSAQALVDAAAAAGRLLQVGYMLRFEEGLGHIRALLAEDALGEIVAARAMIGTYVTLLNARDSERERVPYSLLLDYTHEFDYLRWLLGPIQDVSAAAAERGRLDHRACPNVFQATLGMERGCLVQVHLDYVQHPQRRTLEIYGDRGTLTYDFMSGRLQHLPFGNAAATVTELGPLGTRVDGMYRRQIAHLIDARQQGAQPLVDGRQALAALRLVDAAVESLQSGRRVTVSHILPTVSS